MRNKELWEDVEKASSENADGSAEKQESSEKQTKKSQLRKDFETFYLGAIAIVVLAVLLLITSWSKTVDGVIYERVDGEYVATSVEPGYESITIKSKIGRKEITGIADKAFKDNKTLTSVYIEEGITTIGSEAFSGCTSLTSVTIPKRTINIESSAFLNCSALTAVEIPNGVENINDYAFSGCCSLLSVSIPNSVLSIGNNAFRDCEALTSVTLSENINKISNYTFYGCKSLREITIPENVKEIEKSAFYGCESLKHVAMPSDLTLIGDYAFGKCSSLESASMYLPSSYRNRKLSIGYHIFEDCDKLTTVYVVASSLSPEEATLFTDAIGEDRINVVIPQHITEIGYDAFANCTTIKAVTIHNGVTNIGYRAFDGCTNLSKIYYSGTKYEWWKISGFHYNSNMSVICTDETITY